MIEWEVSTHTPAELSDLIAAPFQWNARDETLKNIIWPDRDYSNDLIKEFHYCRSCPIRKHNPEWDELLCDENLGKFSSDFQIISFDIEYYGVFIFFLVIHYLGIPSNVRVVRVSSTLWFAPAIMRNTYYQKKACDMFGEDAFGNIFR